MDRTDHRGSHQMGYRVEQFITWTISAEARNMFTGKYVRTNIQMDPAHGNRAEDVVHRCKHISEPHLQNYDVFSPSQNCLVAGMIQSASDKTDYRRPPEAYLQWHQLAEWLFRQG
jgi:hypothetical protein